VAEIRHELIERERRSPGQRGEFKEGASADQVGPNAIKDDRSAEAFLLNSRTLRHPAEGLAENLASALNAIVAAWRGFNEVNRVATVGVTDVVLDVQGHGRVHVRDCRPTKTDTCSELGATLCGGDWSDEARHQVLECPLVSDICAAMSEITLADEIALEAVIVDFVKHRLSLGVYDSMQPRRTKMEVVSFQVELLETELNDGMIHAAGPVVLRTPQGDVENFLRLSVEVLFESGAVSIPEDGTVRASYVVETDHPQGACKETAALANA
jgi:hypothetical protein